MYIVLIRGKKHSAWVSESQAYRQATILREEGYKTVQVTRREDEVKQNGHYYL